MPSMNIAGSGSQAHVESQVDPAHQALRTSVRPIDHIANGVIGGHYSATLYSSAAITAGTAGGTQVFSCRWASPSKLMVLLSVQVSMMAVVAYTTMPFDIEMVLARSFTVNATGGGTALTPNSISHMSRSTMAPSEFVSSGQMYPSDAGGIAAGTQTLDSAPVAYACLPTSSLAIGSLGTMTVYNNKEIGEHPIVFSNNQGFVLRNVAAFGAGGSGTLVTTVEWAEVAAY